MNRLHELDAVVAANVIEDAIEIENARGGIVLDEVRPADVGRKTVVGTELEKLRRELTLV